MTNYQYKKQINLNNADSDAEGIIMIEDAQGNLINASIPNELKNIMWTNKDPFGLPGYLEWLAEGNIPKPSRTAEEKLNETIIKDEQEAKKLAKVNALDRLKEKMKNDKDLEDILILLDLV